jgi:dTMP kinase
MTAARGRFITLEGIDGAGKSTHAGFIVETLAARGHAVVATREPGGTPMGERLRDILLAEAMDHETATLLLFAARREHVANVIEPALARGEWVVCDRFTDATLAYQGGGHGVSRAWIEALAAHVHPACNPDLTLLFDVPTEVSKARLASSAAKGRSLDRFEREAQDFFTRVRDAYRQLARTDRRRFVTIDSTRPQSEVRASLAEVLAGLA